jgi:hypothetical protein
MGRAMVAEPGAAREPRLQAGFTGPGGCDAQVRRAARIHCPVADYLASYRLTFLYRENPVVVPRNEAEDRYRPYRDRFLAEPVMAYLHDAYRSRENLGEMESRTRSDATEYSPLYD